ncbi:heavy metal-associated domain-containing protein [Oscillibacter sp.]|uniref:heavy metal-associated domain-containing protein n=1 Tax=Oscillibacter sp. TaxID=1945593 RepID=UPI0028A8DEAC|nr:heavy metal-associated domain-containing protein [Oscillibacter sp.]
MSKASIYFTVDKVNGKHDVKELKRELDTFPGVISVSVNDTTESIAVDYDTTGVEQEQLQKRIEKLGYGIIDTRFENHIM